MGLPNLILKFPAPPPIKEGGAGWCSYRVINLECFISKIIINLSIKKEYSLIGKTVDFKSIIRSSSLFILEKQNISNE